MTGKEIFIIQSNALRIKLEMLKQGKKHRRFAKETGISHSTLTNLLKVAKNDEDDNPENTGFNYSFIVLMKSCLALGLDYIELDPYKLATISLEYNELLKIKEEEKRLNKLKNKENEQSR